MGPPESGEPAIEVSDLCRTLGGRGRGGRVAAVDGVSFRVERGRVLGLFGRNGSGKTTILRLLSGLLLPTRGRVLLLGRPPRHPDVRGRIAWVPEEGELPSFLTAEETLRFHVGLMGERPARERSRVQAALRRFGLAETGRKRVASFSRGMRRRLALAVVLIRRPAVVLLDEPTSGLDPEGRAAFRDAAADLTREGATVVLSSHDPEDRAGLADALIILDAGRVAFQGTPEDLAMSLRAVDLTITGVGPGDWDAIEAAVRARGGAVTDRRAAESAVSARWFARPSGGDAAGGPGGGAP